MNNGLIDRMVQAYAFTASDQRALTETLAKGYLLAKAQAYQAAQTRVGHLVRLTHPWQVNEQEAVKARSWAQQQVASIASTYETLLRHALEQALEPEDRAIGDVVGKVKHAIEAVGHWIAGFLPWKVRQVENHVWGTGTNDGTMQWVSDVQGGDVIGETNILRVKVVPQESSSDACAQIAGKVFTLDKAPTLPMHPNCIHSLEVTIVGE